MKKSWSNKHKKCKKCKTTKYIHRAHGLCALCYQKKWQSEHKEKSCEASLKHYHKNKKKIAETIKKRRAAEKAARMLFNKRLINALRKNGYSDKRITGFFGIKIK